METNELSSYYNMIDESIPEKQVEWFVEKQREIIIDLWRQYDFDEWDHGNNMQSFFIAVRDVFNQPAWVIESKKIANIIDRNNYLRGKIVLRKDKFEEWEHDFDNFINANLKDRNQAIKQILLFIERLIERLKESIKIYKIEYLGTPLTQYFIDKLIYYKSLIDSYLGETRLKNIENLIQHYEAPKNEKPKKEMKTTPPDYSELLKELSDYIDGINENEFNNIIIHHSLSPGTPKAKWKTKKVDAHNFTRIIKMTVSQFNKCFSLPDETKLKANNKDLNYIDSQPIVQILRQYLDK